MSDAKGTEKQSSAPANSNQAKVPGRTTGFTLMTLMILVAGFWLQNSANLSDGNDDAALSQTADTLAGFNADAWFLPADDLLGFVEIPAGEFIMGSNPALDNMAYENERWSPTRRQGSVDLPTYYISRYEVTVAQFNAYKIATGKNKTVVVENAPGNFPVTNVTWAEAVEYGRWLEQQLKTSSLTPPAIRQLLNDGASVTLPTEPEWEKAARGTDGRIFPWGSEPSRQFANFGGTQIAAVGSIPCPACSYGLSDMSGNVWEFTRSPLQDYPYTSEDDFNDLAKDPIWVMRGGAYSDQINNVRAALRGGVDPGVRSPTIGFRIVISTL